MSNTHDVFPILKMGETYMKVKWAWLLVEKVDGRVLGKVKLLLPRTCEAAH